MKSRFAWSIFSALVVLGASEASAQSTRPLDHEAYDIWSDEMAVCSTESARNRSLQSHAVIPWHGRYVKRHEGALTSRSQ